MTRRGVSRQTPLVVATFFGVGYAPVAPGTVGSLAAIPVLVLIRGTAPLWLEASFVVILFALGVWSASAAERLLACEDPGPVVVDEVVGMVIAMVGVPLSWPAVMVAFLAFRVMDIVKPPPARRLERLGGGWGIMADDVAAGVYANLAMQVLLWLRPEWWT
ncbi:MAG: phosphatidylglycerophosphatase A [Acidobacteriota bacterium]